MIEPSVLQRIGSEALCIGVTQQVYVCRHIHPTRPAFRIANFDRAVDARPRVF